jgi:hypothetical protein
VTSSGPARPVGSTPGPAVAAASASAPEQASARDPVLPEQSREDTDAAWGEYPEQADDRLYRDRPPHWDDF